MTGLLLTDGGYWSWRAAGRRDAEQRADDRAANTITSF
jgi:hypothetical protein